MRFQSIQHTSRIFAGFFSLLICAWLFWQPAQAQTNRKNKPSTPTADGSWQAQPQAPGSSTALGATGLNFRYVATLGETGKPYLADTIHLNYARSVTAAGNGIWIGEHWGFRAINIRTDGTVQRVIGNAGYEKYGDQIIQDVNDVAVDAQGNVWLALGQNQVVQYDSAGAVIKAIGQRWNGGSSNDRFQQLASIDFDNKGNLYVSDGAPWWDDDSGNQRIQIFDSSGNYLNTIGVTGEAGSDNQHLHNPRYIAIYADTLYIADTSNHRIQIFNIANPSAPVYQATIGVSGEAGDANNHLDNPNGVMVTTALIYVADTDNNRIQIFDRNTLAFVATIGGNWGDADNEFRHPSDVTVDALGNIYVADFVNSRVQQFNANRDHISTFGVTGVPYVTDGFHYYRPESVAIAADGSLYIAEVNGKRIVKRNATGSVAWTIGQPDLDGGWSGADDRFDSPVDIALDSKGHVYVADRWNNRIQIFDTNGNYQSTLAGIPNGSTVDNFNCPYGIATDRADRLYVADSCNHRVVIFDAARRHLKTLGVKGESGADNGRFNEPSDVVVNSNGVIYVADTRNARVQRFDTNYNYLGAIGETGVVRWSHEHFSSGIGKLAVDSKHHLYVADAWHNRVQVFDADGAYRTTIGGDWGEGTSGSRGATGVAVDAQDKVYLVDAGNHRILQYEPRPDDNWTQTNLNGFGHPQTRGIMSLAAVQGTLYASTSGWDGTGARRLMRSTDGRNWREAIGSSAGSLYNYEFTKLTAFNDNLYVGTSHFNWDKQQTEGGELWRSVNGLAWTAIVTGGFGSPDNGSVGNLIVFDNHLYAATYPFSNTHGFDLWRSSTGNTLDWTRVITNGFGDPKNWILPTLEVFSNTLYAGTSNDATGGELWRSQDGVTWTQVNVDGFGNAKNDVVGSLEVFRGQLYAGVRNLAAGGEIWRSPDGSQWTKVASGGLGNGKNTRPYNLTDYAGHLYVTLDNAETGLAVWRSADGVNWQPISTGGWGDNNNTFPASDWGATVFGGQLYVGTWNEANGGELWRYTADGVALVIANPALAHTLVYTDAQGDLTQISLPAGAVTETVELLYTPLTPAAPPTGFAFGNTAFTLTAFRNNQAQSGFTFAQPVLVTLHYREADVAGMAEASLQLLWYNPQTQSWEEAACGAYNRQPTQNQLTVPICHLSQFGLFGERQAVYLPVVRR